MLRELDIPDVSRKCELLVGRRRKKCKRGGVALEE